MSIVVQGRCARPLCKVDEKARVLHGKEWPQMLLEDKAAGLAGRETGRLVRRGPQALRRRRKFHSRSASARPCTRHVGVMRKPRSWWSAPDLITTADGLLPNIVSMWLHGRQPRELAGSRHQEKACMKPGQVHPTLNWAGRVLSTTRAQSAIGTVEGFWHDPLEPAAAHVASKTI